MKKFYLLAFACMLSGFASYGQGKSQIKRKHVAENGTPHLVEFSTTTDPQPLSKAKDVLKTQLELDQDEEMQVIEQGQDPFGYQHQKYQQFYKGIKVEFGTYSVHAKNGVIESINGDYKKVKKEKKLKTKPGISEAEALEKAMQHIGAQTYMWQTEQNRSLAKSFSNGKKETFFPEAELVIMPEQLSVSRDKDREMVLAYKFDIYAEEPLSRDYVYVNAHTGEIVLVNPIIKHAVANGSGDTRYSGNQSFTTDSYNGSYRLRDYSRGNGIETYDMNEGTNYNSAVDFTDNNNSWTSSEYNNAAKDNAALDAHWGAQKTYDYWKNVHNRTSFDNNGAAIKSYVHYDKDYDNAFWNGSVMTYGDGSDTYFDALTSLDVAAHEIGHAICTYTADLVYQNESGAMNEGFSDIWAATVEHFAAPGKQIWLIGEDIERRAGHQALRSMSDPNSEGQPDTYKGQYWHTSTSDNGGVHTNSGVLNHWFYLLSVGKNGTNDNGNSFSVQGISIEKAAKIAYRLESVYLSSNSTYADARTYSIKAAEDIYGAGSTEAIQTTNAWHAVGIGGKYGEIAYCDSKGGNASYEWIAEVKVGSFTNTSGSAGYTDFTSKTVNLAAGSSYSLSLKPAFSGSAYNEYWKVWIDYNKDGDFDDSGELAFNAGALSKTTVSGTINIPSTAASGTTRMRVSMKYNGAQTSCESFSYGEVEDYTVNIGGSAPVSCGVPSQLATSNISPNSATLKWGTVTNASSYNIRYRRTGTTSWSTTTATSTSISISSLSASTQYEFQVASVCSGGTSAFSGSTTFTTSQATVAYCASNGKNSSYEWIDYVSYGGVERTSASDGGYYNGTSRIASASSGSSSTIYFSAGFSGSSYTEYWRIWIDFNQDGDFADSGEQVVSGSSSSSGTLNATINIPSTAKTGQTRMRISMKYNASPTSCESFSYGEVEDYTLNISNSTIALRNESQLMSEPIGHELKVKPLIEMYPNPASHKLSISTQETAGFGVEVFDLSGKSLKAEKSKKSNYELNVADLKEGIYFIKIKGERETTTLKFVKK